MAGVFFTVSTPAITTGTSKKTLLQIVAATNQRIRVHRITVGFQSTANNEAPPLVQLAAQTTAGTLTAITPVKVNTVDTETLQSTANYSSGSTEPNTAASMEVRPVHSQTTDIFEFGSIGGLPIAGGLKLGVCVTATTSTTAYAHALCEE